MQISPGSKHGILLFFLTLVGLAIVRVVLQYVTFDLSVVPIANVLMTEIFLGVPLLALCFAAQDHWTRKMGLLFFVGGVILQLSCVALNNFVFHGSGAMANALNAIGQVGLPIWCVGLGALLSMLIKDKNLVVPIAIFLACLDMFLVFSPVGVTNIILKEAPSALSSFGGQIPVAAANDSNRGTVTTGSYAGPADFLFLAMFLVALFRFNLKARRTVLVVVPTLLVYMLVVGLFHLKLPALVPIGVCVLLVNWREFRLSREEKISTAWVAVFGVALFTWGMFQKPKIVEQEVPSRRVSVPAPPESPDLP